MTQNTPTTTTCQICGRPIKSARGRIAHHGYRRPFRRSGFQTSSCEGAQQLPYEYSRDHIATVIQRRREGIDIAANALTIVLTTPPPNISYHRNNSNKLLKVDRPAGFDQQKLGYTGIFDTYEYQYRELVFDLYADITHNYAEIARLQARYDAWINPEAR